MFDFLLPGIRLWFWLGAIGSFVAGFFAMSEGSIFHRTSGNLFLAVLFFAIIGTVTFIGVRASFGAAVVTFFIYWTILGFGGRLMVRLLRG